MRQDAFKISLTLETGNSVYVKNYRKRETFFKPKSGQSCPNWSIVSHPFSNITS